MDTAYNLAELLNLPVEKIVNTVSLLQEGNTVPFIARYRKEITGGLNEGEIFNIEAEHKRLTNLDERRQTILKTIEAQGKLTNDLKQQILQSRSLTELEDLYLPFRPKKLTRAQIAREKGLEPLAEMIIKQEIFDLPLPEIIAPFLSEEVPNLTMALTGASDIVAEFLSENAAIRKNVRKIIVDFGNITSEKIEGSEDKQSVFDVYYHFKQRIKFIHPHQILAINRGEREKILKVDLLIPEKDCLIAIKSVFIPNSKSIFFDVLNSAIANGAQRLLFPSIKRDIRRALTETAENHAIQVFAKNLYGLLTQPPLKDHVILGIDPGFRTGSKIAVIDATGKVLETATIFPHPPQNQKENAYRVLNTLINSHNVSLIVIGNGTASRETEIFVAEITKQNPSLHYLIANEAGASVYSASNYARKELPDLDVSLRGAVSIARRVQDPLAELVKIDPKSIGVGLYQHDVNQPQLSKALDQVVTTVVNKVGVDVNTASTALLSYISGIGPLLAERIIQYRIENGAFNNRSELKAVQGMGKKTFEQSAGFLRIRNGEIPLDATAIHPESYWIAEKVLQELEHYKINNNTSIEETIHKFVNTVNLEDFSKLLKIGLPTLQDILDELARPGRDPREEIPKPVLRKDVISINDLSQGMMLKGTIRNIVDFGIFVDLGVNIDGLLHRSKIKQSANLSVGDIIEVEILNIDQDRNRIALAMKE